MKPDTTSTISRWLPAIKVAGSFCVVFHLLAVFWAPFRLVTTTPEGGSPFVNWPDKLIFERYYQPLYLDHGYAFFAPNPGPTHVVDFRVFNESGDIIKEGRFPWLPDCWPRLRYHRYFMLGENLNQLFVPAEPPDAKLPPDVLKSIAKQRVNYVTLKNAIEQGLAREYRGSHAVVERVSHRAPTYQEFMEGWSLTDPRLFERLPEHLPKAEEVRK
jgi:hypothetical protein